MTRFAIALTAAIVALAALVPAASAHTGNPNYQSQITNTSGLPAGVSVEIINRDDSLQLVNRGKQDIVVLGYEDEPYVRLTANGEVSVNQNSKATFINEDRQGLTKVPAGVDSGAAPEWKLIDKSGRYIWHDHRIHWMGAGTPPQVKDTAVRAKVFDWKITMTAGGRPALVSGVLHWTPDEKGGAPTAAIVGFALLLIASAAIVVRSARRRGRADQGAAKPQKESW